VERSVTRVSLDVLVFGVILVYMHFHNYCYKSYHQDQHNISDGLTSSIELFGVFVSFLKNQAPYPREDIINRQKNKKA